jgi:hypothetical protein
MALIFYLWYLFAMPYDRHVCDLWVSTPPGHSAVVEACGPYVARSLETYQFRAVQLSGGYVACSGNASALYDLPCDLWPLDAYRLEIWREGKESQLLCSIKLDHTGYPSRAEIADQCDHPDALEKYDAGQTTLDFLGAYPQASTPDPVPVCSLPAPTVGTSLSQTPALPELLATDQPYALLAGKLIWYGIVRPECGGLSGLDPITLAPTGCGMLAARDQVRAWQNQFDGSIHRAASDAGVPAVMLKAVIGVESQFWPIWSPPDGETGAAQITADGLDIPMRYDPGLYAEACPLALSASRCSLGYTGLSELEQSYIRYALAAWMTCPNCSVAQAVDKLRADIPLYARVLRAWRCYTEQIAPGSPDPWREAVAAYHAGGTCITGAGICAAGQEYLRRLEQ